MTIIGLSGKKGSGKDNTAQLIFRLIENNPNIKAINIGFADALKREVSHATGQSVEFINEHKENFRLLLQAWGTNYKRQLVSDTYWIDIMDRTIDYFKECGINLVIITDVRFINEFEFIKSRGGIVVRVVRNFKELDTDKHESETQLDNAPFDYFLANIRGLDELKLETEELLRQFKIL